MIPVFIRKLALVVLLMSAVLAATGCASLQQDDAAMSTGDSNSANGFPYN